MTQSPKNVLSHGWLSESRDYHDKTASRARNLTFQVLINCHVSINGGWFYYGISALYSQSISEGLCMVGINCLRYNGNILLILTWWSVDTTFFIFLSFWNLAHFFLSWRIFPGLKVESNDIHGLQWFIGAALPNLLPLRGPGNSEFFVPASLPHQVDNILGEWIWFLSGTRACRGRTS